jgi:hypothetical protein
VEISITIICDGGIFRGGRFAPQWFRCSSLERSPVKQVRFWHSNKESGSWQFINSFLVPGMIRHRINITLLFSSGDRPSGTFLGETPNTDDTLRINPYDFAELQVELGADGL